MLTYAQLVINEGSNKNFNLILDEDEESEDWIEIYNSADYPINLNGYFLTDDEEDLLDKAWGLEPKSRLSCQTIVDNNDLTIEIPKYTINMVSERH